MNEIARLFPDPAPASHATGIGQPMRRKEDGRLLTGKGRYTDDVSRPGQLYVAIVRSPHAHGIINGIDVSPALDMPGVVAAYTGQDLADAGFGPMPDGLMVPNSDGTPAHRPSCPALAVERVRFVGDPVAFVVAETMGQAKDAADAVLLDIELLPAVTSARVAAEPGAPLLHEAAPGNVATYFHHGDSAEVAAAFAKAAHVTRLELLNNRLVVCPMEPRSALSEYDAEQGRWTLYVGCQGVFGLRNNIAKSLLKGGKEKLRILTGNVGGSFGMKAAAYPEYACLFHAARMLGRPAKWTDDRSGSFLSDSHGRDHEMIAELALDADGRFLAVRLNGWGNLGAYPGQSAGLPATINAAKNLLSVYRTPLIEVTAVNVFTNTVPVGAYRGAGRPEGNYYMERLIDTAAAEMGIDRVEMRRRNHVPPDAMPYSAPSGMVYDGGEFPAILEEALVAADWDGFAARREESRGRGKLRGRGIGHYLEVTAPPSAEMGGIRFEKDGSVTIITGTLDYGQGHASSFSQVLNDHLGVPFERINLLQGDSDELIAGGGTGGSKSMMASGAAIVEASVKVIEQGRALAGILLEVSEQDVEFTLGSEQGQFSVPGTDLSIGIMDLAEKIRTNQVAGVPAGGLDVQHVFQHAPSAFPNGCHIAEVEIDPETGITDVVRYSMVSDFGVLINPMLVDGQVHGGVVQGIGQALMEHAIYDGDGQLLTGSFMDYALPRAEHAPPFLSASHPVAAKTNPLGVKGCGEAGCAGSLPAVMNAVVDALSERGIRHIDMPATPARIWQALDAASASQGHPAQDHS